MGSQPEMTRMVAVTQVMEQKPALGTAAMPPLDLGLLGINNALRQMGNLWDEMTSLPLMRMGAVMPSMPSQPSLGGMPLGERVTVEVNGNGGGTPANGNTYNIYPTYREFESDGNLVQTVRMLQMEG
jgi:hypothetical protein